ncbi:MAG: hypothetical protein JWO58_2444 [Chitinophagaceae bacterium]|nr:hypothetical protein [Chitinophagaceae bacterium]
MMVKMSLIPQSLSFRILITDNCPLTTIQKEKVQNDVQDFLNIYYKGEAIMLPKARSIRMNDLSLLF